MTQASENLPSFRYFIELTYLGKNYAGWQSQPNAPSVQSTLETALSTLLRHQAFVVGSGRTDAGVHAKQQFAHFDTPTALDLETLHYRLNALLPADIAVRKIYPTTTQAHARYDAKWREYVYVIGLQKNSFLFENVALHHLRQNLDLEKLNAAAAIFLEYIDFESFSKVKTDVKHFDCTLTEAKWYQQRDFLFFHVKANRFLRGMVRTMVGTLLKAGAGKLSTDELRAILDAKDRKKAGVAAPPQGLYLYQVHYPDTIFQTEPPLRHTFDATNFESLPFF
ncbi:tRNA pseudouridine(38-40) synthase TruA [Hugenholtzia roseola]|uniref:tRNA pseudouridine(38-40) synthase TruA n=1 Tax=Hugenholtzia roseola TaxID=1002 RepID=UPI00040DEC3A|nr:tRNA pseudouridine(38-40) synthase TruA [Hugenholtzia roseola]